MSLKILQQHLNDYRRLLRLPAEKRAVVRRFRPSATILVVSPHPDDEVLMSALALRLQKENRCQVINVAVTLGSSPARKSARKKELAAAVKFLGWKSVLLADDWSKKRQQLTKLMARHKPALIIAPHLGDRHPTHVKTAELVKSVLKKHDGTIAWAEYWQPQPNPNLLVEVSDEIFLKQVKALQFHEGEVSRNPYHLRLMGWQMDSVRRGSEWLADKGAASAPMLLGQLYRLEKWEKGRAKKTAPEHFATAKSDLTDWL